MKLALAFAVLLLVGGVAQAAPCVKCISLRCSSIDNGYTNCGSNGSFCTQWGACGVGGVDCEAPNDCQQGSLSPHDWSVAGPAWRLASVDVRPAPRPRPEWRLSKVTVLVARKAE